MYPEGEPMADHDNHLPDPPEPSANSTRDRGDIDAGSLADQQLNQRDPFDDHTNTRHPAENRLNQPDLEQDIEEEFAHIRMEEIRITHQLIQLIQKASLGDAHDSLDAKSIDRIRNPPEQVLTVEDPDLRLSIDIYLSVGSASQDTYNSIRENICRRYPDSQMLSHDQVKRRVAELSGIVPIMNDMCINSCAGFTGPWSECE
jgi:hypothetical protein